MIFTVVVENPFEKDHDRTSFIRQELDRYGAVAPGRRDPRPQHRPGEGAGDEAVDRPLQPGKDGPGGVYRQIIF